MAGTRGRPSKLTPEVQKAICDLIEHGNYEKVAAEANGIDQMTMMRWMKQGETPGQPSQYKEFREAVLRARARGESRDVLLIEKLCAEAKDPRVLLERLSRRYPERWGRRVVELAGPDGAEPIIRVQLKLED